VGISDGAFDRSVLADRNDRLHKGLKKREDEQNGDQNEEQLEKPDLEGFLITVDGSCEGVAAGAQLSSQHHGNASTDTK
jgi:hypothetical protein